MKNLKTEKRPQTITIRNKNKKMLMKEEEIMERVFYDVILYIIRRREPKYRDKNI